MNAVSHEEHGREVKSMFGRIARWYDFLNRFLSAGQDCYWRYRLVRTLNLPPQALVLDMAAGTMDVTMEILRRHPDARVAAMDFTRPMLVEGARRKLVGVRRKKVLPVQADGRAVPLPDACVDGAAIAFGIRNILPREEAWSEFYRVLKPGGRVCVLEFGTGSRRVWRGVYNFYLDRLLPFIGRVVSGDSGAYRYLADTIRSFPDERVLAQEIRDAGFDRVYHVPLLSGIVYLHVGEKAG